MTGVEVAGEQVNAARGNTRFVDRRDIPYDLCAVAAFLVDFVTEIGVDFQGGFAQNGAPVRAETNGVISGVRSAEFAVRDDQPHGQAVFRIEKVPVDTAYHPVAVGFQIVYRARHGADVRQRIAVCNNGLDIAIGLVRDEIFGAEVGVIGTPKDVAGQAGVLMNDGISLSDLRAEGLRVGRGRGRERQQGRQDKKKRQTRADILHC